MAVESTSDRITRMLGLMSYLAASGPAHIDELAEHFGVSRKQIMNDIYQLWMVGTPGYGHANLVDFTMDDEETTVSLLEAQGLIKPVPFAPREALALIAAVEWLWALGAPPAVAATLDSVRNKLRGLLPAGVADATPLDVELRSQILHAVNHGSGLSIRYVSALDEVTERLIQPQALTTDGSHWYVDAWCTRAGERRTFRTDRILAAAPARAPGRTEPPSLSDEKAAQPTLVRMVLRPGARWLAEEIPGVTLRELPGPLLEVELELTDWAWLIRRLLGLGADLVAVHPPELRAELRERASTALAAYAASQQGASTPNR